MKSAEGSSTEDPKIILSEMRNFYQQLYTSQGQTSTACSLNFLNYESLPRLDNAKQNLCEGLITKAECLSALKTFQRNKTLTSSPRSLFFLPPGARERERERERERPVSLSLSLLGAERRETLGTRLIRPLVLTVYQQSFIFAFLE